MNDQEKTVSSLCSEFKVDNSKFKSLSFIFESKKFESEEYSSILDLINICTYTKQNALLNKFSDQVDDFELYIFCAFSNYAESKTIAYENIKIFFNSFKKIFSTTKLDVKDEIVRSSMRKICILILVLLLYSKEEWEDLFELSHNFLLEISQTLKTFSKETFNLFFLININE